MVTITGGDRWRGEIARMGAGVRRAAHLKVGFLEGADYPDGTPVAMVAAIQNFGAPSRGIPPRPFFTNMVKERGPRWPAQLALVLRDNEYEADTALSIMGEGIAGQLRQSIQQTMAPALSPVTLMLRKMKSQDQSLVVTGATVGEAARRVAAGESVGGVSTKPLVETGHLYNSVDYEVRG